MRALLLLLCLAAALPAAAQNTNEQRDVRSFGPSDWEREQQERNFREPDMKLPAMPKPGALIEFFPSSASSFRFFIDAASFEVAGDGLVRYTLVARSASGYDNVSYEGIRCRSRSVRIYAYANGGTWSRASGDWKPIEMKTVQRWHNELYSRYFCPLGAPVNDTAEGLNALRRGGHPLAAGTHERY